MKINLFAQAPYRFLPPDFEQHHESVCSTPYTLTNSEGIYSSMRNFMDELMIGARAGFDGVAVNEHSQSSYDLTPNPNLIASAVAYLTEVEGLPAAVYPMGRSLGKTREPIRVAEEYAMLDVMSGGRLIAGFPVGLSYDASVNNGVPPIAVRERFHEHLDLILRAWREQQPFAFNGRFGQYPQVNIWPRPLQAAPPVFITGIGNPSTMRLSLERGFGFNYFGFAGAKLTGQRIFDRFWDIADEVGVERNPYRMGFLQTIAVAETDAAAERLYGEHAEYAFRKGLGSIPPGRLALPGGLDIRGVQALLRDPADFGLYYEMRTAPFRKLADAGVVIAGSPATVRDQLIDYCRSYRIGNLNAMLSFGSLPTELARKNIELFATEVMPHLRKLWQDTDFEHHWWPQRLGGATPAPQRIPSAVDGKVTAR